MKKLLSVLLAVLCLFSMFTVCAGADNIIDEISDEFDDQAVYCIIYQSETLSQVKLMYVPSPTTALDAPGYVTVTNDTPIAIDYDFVCWKDGHGRYYKPGDKIYVNGTVTLYPVWEAKTDSDSHVMRIIKAALASLVRILQKVFGVFKEFEEFDAEYNATTVTG